MKNIKFIHMADLHIGSSAYQKLNINEMSTLHSIIDNANNQECDFILICGDLFHEKPNTEIQERVSSIFSNFSGKIFIIYGNHDFETSSEMQWPDNTKILGLKGMENLYLDELNVRIWGHSYDEQQIKEYLINDYFNCNILDENEINILMAHGGDKLHIPIDFNDISKKFRYAALGHIHNHTIVKPNVVYSGSLIPQNRLETDNHGYLIVNINDDVTIDLIEVCSLYKKISFDITNFINIEDVYKALNNLLTKDNLYILTLIGTRNPLIKLDIYYLETINNIEQIIDETTLSIDFDSLRNTNKDNILGIFIDRMQHSSNPRSKRALELGVEAFLEARSNDN